ncbi:hypothetical protein BGX27_002806, partial [Mortierella sp. AM989]
MPHITLADFLQSSPENLGPIAFIEVFGGGQDWKDLKSTYVALFTEAINFQDPSIVQQGQEMKERWTNGKTAFQKYWNELELERIQEKNIMKAARRVSKLDNATGEHQLKKSLLKFKEWTNFQVSAVPPGSLSRSVSVASTLKSSTTLADPVTDVSLTSSAASVTPDRKRKANTMNK